uniref:Uncharacterized protein n=1 Tax=Chloropicon laureae TaxID=464258 RepID=A0A7S3E5D1_9CHLO
MCVSLSAGSVVAQDEASKTVATVLAGLTDRGSERIAGGRSRGGASERRAGRASRWFGREREQSEPEDLGDDLGLLEPLFFEPLLLDEVEERMAIFDEILDDRVDELEDFALSLSPVSVETVNVGGNNGFSICNGRERNIENCTSQFRN